MDDNTRKVLQWLILYTSVTIVSVILIISILSYDISKNPITFRIESDNNTVEIAKQINTTSCKDVEVVCKCNNSLSYYNNDNLVWV